MTDRRELGCQLLRFVHEVQADFVQKFLSLQLHIGRDRHGAGAVAAQGQASAGACGCVWVHGFDSLNRAAGGQLNCSGPGACRAPTKWSHHHVSS